MVNFILYLIKHFSLINIIMKEPLERLLHEQYSIDWEIFCSQGNNGKGYIQVYKFPAKPISEKKTLQI